MPEDVISLFNFSDLLSLITPGVLWVFFGIVVLIVVIVSLILYYHWLRYSLHPLKVITVGIVYTTGTIALILLSGSLLIIHIA